MKLQSIWGWRKLCINCTCVCIDRTESHIIQQVMTRNNHPFTMKKSNAAPVNQRSWYLPVTSRNRLLSTENPCGQNKVKQNGSRQYRHGGHVQKQSDLATMECKQVLQVVPPGEDDFATDCIPSPCTDNGSANLRIPALL